MTAAEVQDLFAEVDCYTCLGLTGEQVLKLGLLRRWLLLLDATADTSVSALMTSSACFACYGGSTYDLLELALLSLIVDAL